MRNVWMLAGITLYLLAGSQAIGQIQQNGCLTERPPVRNGPGYPMGGPPPSRTFCAPPGGTIVEDDYGVLVCGVGQCIDDANGKTLCAREKGGAVIVDANGQIKCVGGCVRPDRHLCRVPQR